MKATVTKAVNSRVQPNTAANKLEPKSVGSTLEVVAINIGETYQGSNLWFQDDQGLHYTSHAIALGATNNLLSPYVDFSALWTKLGRTDLKIGIYDSGVTQNTALFQTRVTQLNHTDSDVKDYHASYMAGIIAAADLTNGYVGFLPTAKIYSYKCPSGPKGPIIVLDDFKVALQKFIAQGVDVINVSMSSNDNNDNFKNDDKLSQLLDTCRNQDIIVVAATGNNADKSDYTPYYPAKRDEIYSASGCNLAGLPSPVFYPGSNLWSGTSLLAPVDTVFTPGFFTQIPIDGTTGTSVSSAICSSLFGAFKIRNQTLNSGNGLFDYIDQQIKAMPGQVLHFAPVQQSSFPLLDFSTLNLL